MWIASIAIPSLETMALLTVGCLTLINRNVTVSTAKLNSGLYLDMFAWLQLAPGIACTALGVICSYDFSECRFLFQWPFGCAGPDTNL